jgi:hypothetical protein
MGVGHWWRIARRETAVFRPRYVDFLGALGDLAVNLNF